MVLLPILGTIGNALRVPALVAFIANLAAQAFGWFAKHFTGNTVINLTVLSMLIALTLALMAAIYSLVGTLSYVVPEELNVAFALFIPDNAIPCMSVIISGRILRWVWSWKVYAITKVAG